MARVALIQIDVGTLESPAERITRITEQIRELAGKCDIVVLPELWAVGPFNSSAFHEEPCHLNPTVLKLLGETARQSKLWLHAGSFIEDTPEGLTNTAVVINSLGEQVARYRKIHLFGFDQGEAKLLSRGHELVTFSDSQFGVVGIATCYDLRFPELFRGLTKLGANTFMLTSGWPINRIEHWRVLLQARAIENQAWIVACNSVGLNESAELGGHSMVINPKGEIVVEAQDKPGVIFADVDVDEALNWRHEFPVLKDQVLG